MDISFLFAGKLYLFIPFFFIFAAGFLCKFLLNKNFFHFFRLKKWSKKEIFLRPILLFFSMSFLLFSLAGPVCRFELRGYNYLVLLDVTHSMLCLDYEQNGVKIDRLEIAGYKFFFGKGQKAFGRGPGVKGGLVADGHAGLEDLGGFNGIDTDPHISFDDVQMNGFKGGARHFLHKSSPHAGKVVGAVEVFEEPVKNRAHKILAGQGVLPDKFIGFQHLEDSLDRGRTELQGGTQLPDPP